MAEETPEQVDAPATDGEDAWVEHVDSEEDEPLAPVPREHWEPTGHPAVDEVLASLDVVDGQSVHDHVAVFEEAHRSLRRALDDDTGHDTGQETGASAAGPA